MNSIANKISIIIPAAIGDVSWYSLINNFGPWIGQFEILIVTAEKPETLPEGVTWVKGRGRRAENLNDGVKSATRDYLWFVHADSYFEENAVEGFFKILQKNQKGLYYFDLNFAKDGPALMSLNTWGANMRSRVFGVPFGDQAFCIERALFEQVGRYDENLKNGEDHLFVWQCRHQSIPLIPVKEKVSTSARRYSDEGWGFVVLKFQYRWLRDAIPQYIKYIFRSRRG